MRRVRSKNEEQSEEDVLQPPPRLPGWRFFTHCIFAVAGLTGFEPATSRVTGERSKPLSYNPTPCIIGRKYQIPSEKPHHAYAEWKLTILNQNAIFI